MPDHPHLQTIRKYYEGCSKPDIEMMMSTLTSDVTHYFTDNPPVHGAEALAKHWADFTTNERKCLWTVDSFVATDNEAAIEWTMISTFVKEGRKAILRGAEWYTFRERKIAEIRAYYLWTEEQQENELVRFPYKERGYPVK